MTKPMLFVLTVAAVCLFAACPAPDANNSANTENANTNAEETTSAAPTKEALFALEKSAYEAWKNKDADFWGPFLSDKFVGYGQTGKLDKAAAVKEYAGAECDVKSVAFSDETMTPLGADAAFITYKVSVDGTCGGQKLPASSWAVGAYVREDGKWKGAFHAEAPVADPNAPAAAPASAPAASETKEEAAKPDAATEALFAVEKKAWEDWKAKNKEGMEAFAGKNMTSLSPTDGWTSRDVTLKRWSEDPCEIKSVSLTNPGSVSLGADYALLTFDSSVEGTCGGQAVPAERGATIYAKEDGAWKAVMTFGTPKK
ncbi:MAG: nuclear transport factor 2 family protein [Acidobacteriota bacterium]|nr:MAG: nuclear transport factor 2 family protein [Acidobacteriota bacterium]